MTASCTALGSLSDSTTEAHASAFASAVGRAARAVAACRSPAEVLSRSSSAAISVSSARPVAASRCSSAQRSSVSTARPSIVSRAVQQPGEQVELLRRYGPSAAKARAHASWWSLPGSAARRCSSVGVGPAGQPRLAPRRVRRTGRAPASPGGAATARRRCRTPCRCRTAPAPGSRGWPVRRRASCPRRRPSTGRAAATRSKSPRCSVTNASDSSSRRTFAYDRSSSLSRTTAGRARARRAAAPRSARRRRPARSGSVRTSLPSSSRS